MKKRVLKPTVEKILITIVIIQLMLLCSLADFELRAIPFILAFLALLAFNTKILVKYARKPLTNDEV